MPKPALLAHLTALLEGKLSAIEADIASTLHARNSDTKSSAGDKHEVGRAMVQQELDRSEIQRAKDIPDPVNIARLNALHPTANG